MQMLPFPQDDTPIQGERIRKQWHNGEWYFSVIDVIAQLLETDHKRAQSYWTTLKGRLKKEGAQSVTTCDKLKMVSADGKTYNTDVMNREQILRLIQSIPSPKVEPMKLWLAQVGAERLEAFNDPEADILASFERAVGKYKQAGKTDSWIEARIQGIVTRKEFVEALKNAVLEADMNLYAQTTEKLYRGLWERTTSQLRGDLNIDPKENPRDHFGEYALIYTRIAEKLATDKLGQAETVTFSTALDIVWRVAKEISKQAKATSRMLGIDLVTEKPLLTSKN